MGRLTNSKKEKLIRIETARYELDKHLETGFIKEEDIMYLASRDINFGLKTVCKKYNYKASVLKDIFNSPFILCDQERLSDNLKSLLPLFLNSRYQTEKEMLDFYLKEAYITKEEYDKELDELDFVFYKSSNEGKIIQKTGKLSNTSKKTIKKSLSTIDYELVNEYFQNVKSSVIVTLAGSKIKIVINSEEEIIVQNYEMLNKVISKLSFPVKINFINIRLGIAKRLIEYVKQYCGDVRSFIRQRGSENNYDVLFIKEKEIENKDGIQKLKTLI